MLHAIFRNSCKDPSLILHAVSFPLDEDDDWTHGDGGAKKMTGKSSFLDDQIKAALPTQPSVQESYMKKKIIINFLFINHQKSRISLLLQTMLLYFNIHLLSYPPNSHA